MLDPDPTRRGEARHSSWVFPLLFAIGLSIVHTWPLATHPAALSSNDNADAQLNEWILAWVAHALPRDPLHLFQANIFYPANDSLAFSEPLIVPALMGAPLAWLGGSPVLVFNLVMYAGFALTALATYRLIFEWTGSRLAAALAGSTFAFNTHTLTRLAHVQALHLYGLPIALLAVDRLVSFGRTRDAWLLAASLIVLAYTSGYLMVFGAVMVAVALLVRAPEWLPRWRQVGSRLAIAGVISAAAIAPLSLPYQRAAREQGMVRSLDAVSEYSATLGGYLAASGRLHVATWSGSFFTDPVNSFFPGLIVLVLAIVALVAVLRDHRHAHRRDRGSAIQDPVSRELSAGVGVKTSLMARRRILMLAAIAATGFVLSLGTHTPVYGWLYAIFPPMHGLRVAARFGNLFLLGMSGLAAFGLTRLQRDLQAHPALTRFADVVIVVLVAVANVEALRAPIAYRPFAGVPRLYALLADEPRVVLAEMPFYPRQATFENAEYVLNSTAHWQPLMNGYSGYTPASYAKFADAFWYFPRDYAIDAIRRAGVTHVMVHPDRFGNEAADVMRQLDARPDFELLGTGARGLRLYRLR